MYYINIWIRSKAVGVSPTPGFTKVMQEVQLDKLVKLLDCPGVVFDDSDGAAVLLKNCVDVESMPDPAPAVEAVLQRCQPEQLMQVKLLVTVYA
jgi:nuclear GTP-binding protein